MNIDPAIQNIILGVIANGLTSFIAYAGQKGKEALGLDKDTKLAGILQQSILSIPETAQVADEQSNRKLRNFLTSPEAEAIVRQIYASQVTTRKSKSHIESIRAEFKASLSLYLGLSEHEVRHFAEALFDTILAGCEQALATAIDKGILSAHEAKSALRHRIVLDELEAIKKNLDFLTASHKLNLQAILEFEEKYRQQVADRHKFIIPPNFDSARKIPIDDLYVPPGFVTTPKKKGEGPEVLKTTAFLSVIYRAVLLGNPGGGKSTFALKLCYDLATRYSERLLAGRQVTPILVVLRDYGAEKKTRNCSILQFIEATANSKYQVQPSPGAFEYLLLNSRVVVVFDGLDELLDTSYRQEISGDIESFCTMYSSVPVVVTSREVGYEQAPLDEKRFDTFRLAPFDDKQVKDYVTKWFIAETDLTHEQGKQKTEALVRESQIVPDLRSNPLMLALMCNIYRGENYIPRNRPDVYEKCALMLFERWDKSRGIFVPLPIEAHIRPTMMYLAHWIYTNETLQGGITEKSLVAKASEYLSPRRFEDHDQAEKASREFIGFCRGRAWVFTDTGTTKDGERLYQFTHRTFLEYFTATHLVRTYPTPDKLGEILLPKIAKREWDVVAQLAFQIQNKNVEGAGDDLLSDLLNQAGRVEEDEKWNLLSFTARTLEFIVPSPRVIRDIATACIEACLTWDSKRIKRESIGQARANGHSEPEELLGGLVNAAIENRTTIANSLEKLLTEQINSGSEATSLHALEISTHFTLPLYRPPMMQRPQEEVLSFWNSVEARILDTCTKRIEELCPKHFAVWLLMSGRMKLSIINLVKWHGVESIFRQGRYTMFPSLTRWSLAETLIAWLIRDYGTEKPAYLNERLRLLREIGQVLPLSPIPWARRLQFTSMMFSHVTDQPLGGGVTVAIEMNQDPDALFGGFALFATVLEMNKLRREHTDMITEIKKSRDSFFGLMRWTLLARFEQVETHKVQTEMQLCGFTREQQDFVWRWVRGEISLAQ